MKNKNNISRRDFLLINYIKEAISRRSFLTGMLGSLATTQLPKIASADDTENDIILNFLKLCLKRLKKYKSTNKVEYTLLKTIFYNSNFRLSRNEDYITISRIPRGSSNIFGRDYYGQRDTLAKKLGRLGEKMLDKVENIEELNPEPFSIKIFLSPENFVDEYIYCIKSFLKKQNNDYYPQAIWDVAFQSDVFNDSEEFRSLIKKLNIN